MSTPIPDRIPPELPARPPVTAGTHEPERVPSDAVAADPAVVDAQLAAADSDRVEHERQARLRRWASLGGNS